MLRLTTLKTHDFRGFRSRSSRDFSWTLTRCTWILYNLVCSCLTASTTGPISASSQERLWILDSQYHKNRNDYTDNSFFYPLLLVCNWRINSGRTVLVVSGNGAVGAPELHGLSSARISNETVILCNWKVCICMYIYIYMRLLPARVPTFLWFGSKNIPKLTTSKQSNTLSQN